MAPEKILIVDDEPNALESLSDVLKDAGYDIKTALDGKTGLESVKKTKFSLAILDIVLPDIDGIAILKEIKQINPEIEVIMISGHATLENSIKALNEGAYAYILKPFNPDDVKSTIGRAIEKQKISLERDRLLKELQESNQELNKALKNLKEAQNELIREERLAALGELSASVAHELNNYLGIAFASTEVLLSSIKKTPKIKEDMDRINRALERSAEIVKNLLEFAKKRKPKMQCADINKIVDEAISITKPLIRWKSYELIKNYNANIPMLKVNGGRLQQVFLNILLNIAHAMPDGGRIEIETTVHPNKNSAQISFTDTGPGMTQNKINKLFTPFFSSRKNNKGTGLGLFISNGIVNQHNGSIDVKSKVGKGTTFIINLPIKNRKNKKGINAVGKASCLNSRR